jgi:hypothetical protein
MLEPGLPEGAAIQFYLEATDANNTTTYLPVSPEEAEDSGVNDLYVLGFGQGRSPVEISEVVSDNHGIFQDESMGTPDYIELANVSGEPVVLDGYGLIDRTLIADHRFVFPHNTTLQPGQTIIVICDRNVAQGPLHANFSINNSGDKIYLQQKTPTGIYVTVDAVDVPALGRDMAYARVWAHGPWEILPGSPNAANLVDGQIRFYTRPMTGGVELTLIFQVAKDEPYTIESGVTVKGPWTSLGNGVGTQTAGEFHYTVHTDERQRFFRVRTN